ncbi:hypothetical protein FM106_24600 [Brachybacterium faecium]|nr:hypothetical protein FM106_24600 [Brachybacterium faecium]
MAPGEPATGGTCGEGNGHRRAFRQVTISPPQRADRPREVVGPDAHPS